MSLDVAHEILWLNFFLKVRIPRPGGEVNTENTTSLLDRIDDRHCQKQGGF